ncbi:MAG TPA: glycosyltransferase [Blastocatellia bacterium]|nr:glycosyltransferase [Blastocatellia bacterium]
MSMPRPSFRARLSAFIWRSLARYGRFKYRRLLPLYRSLGLWSKRSRVTDVLSPVASLRRAQRLTDWLLRSSAARLNQQVETIAARAALSHGTIIFLPSVGWHVVNTQRGHHLAREFARQGYTVIFDCSNSYDPVNGVQEIAPNLFLFRGDPVALAALPPAILWTLAYNFEYGKSFARPALRVYDWIDDLSVFPYERGFLEAGHAQAMAEAELILCVAHRLHAEAHATRPDAVYLPNAVDYGHFVGDQKPLPRDPQMAALATGQKPVAGYVGALAEWFDYELLDEVAARRPDWQFVLIGPALDMSLRERGRRLLARANVAYLGPRPYADLPAYLRQFDVAMIPFVINDITQATSPLKLYEYWAAGKPVLTTPLPECRAFAEVTLAADPAEFASALDEARRLADDAQYRERLRQLAFQNSWTVRVTEVAGLLKAHMNPGKIEEGRR